MPGSSPPRFAAHWPLAGAAVAASNAVFDEQRIAAPWPRPRTRRRVQHEGKAFLDLGDLGLDVGGDLLGAAVALVERLQDRKATAP